MKRIFSAKGGGQVTPIPLSFFGQNDFRLRGGRDKSVGMEGKNLVVFVVDDNKTKSEEVLSSNVASSD